MRKFSIALMLCIASTSLHAKELIGLYGDWGAFKSGRSCYAISAPKTVASGRGGAQLVVTRWATNNYQVMISTGAAMRDVSLRAGGQRFSLTPRGGDAWLPDAKGDAAALAALGASNSASVEGRSARGNRVSDSYSLTGFTDAWTAAQKACN
jgi:hypothetical protein